MPLGGKDAKKKGKKVGQLQVDLEERPLEQSCKVIRSSGAVRGMVMRDGTTVDDRGVAAAPGAAGPPRARAISESDIVDAVGGQPIKLGSGAAGVVMLKARQPN
eukprot:SAG31_NODE_11589_length_1015_cov_1.264192_1_plen_104_part_00